MYVVSPRRTRLIGIDTGLGLRDIDGFFLFCFVLETIWRKTKFRDQSLWRGFLGGETEVVGCASRRLDEVKMVGKSVWWVSKKNLLDDEQGNHIVTNQHLIAKQNYGLYNFSPFVQQNWLLLKKTRIRLRCTINLLFMAMNEDGAPHLKTAANRDVFTQHGLVVQTHRPNAITKEMQYYIVASPV